jgi:hypothetical protein
MIFDFRLWIMSMIESPMQRYITRLTKLVERILLIVLVSLFSARDSLSATEKMARTWFVRTASYQVSDRPG